jgi:hypothetical protein
MEIAQCEKHKLNGHLFCNLFCNFSKVLNLMARNIWGFTVLAHFDAKINTEKLPLPASSLLK